MKYDLFVIVYISMSVPLLNKSKAHFIKWKFPQRWSYFLIQHLLATLLPIKWNEIWEHITKRKISRTLEWLWTHEDMHWLFQPSNFSDKWWFLTFTSNNAHMAFCNHTLCVVLLSKAALYCGPKMGLIFWALSSST